MVPVTPIRVFASKNGDQENEAREGGGGTGSCVSHMMEKLSTPPPLVSFCEQTLLPDHLILESRVHGPDFKPT